MSGTLHEGKRPDVTQYAMEVAEEVVESALRSGDIPSAEWVDDGCPIEMPTRIGRRIAQALTSFADSHANTKHTSTDDADADTYARVGPGHETAPAILEAMLQLRRDIQRARDAQAALLAALGADGNTGHGMQYSTGPGLSTARTAIDSEIRNHRKYLASGEPERLAGVAR